MLRLNKEDVKKYNTLYFEDDDDFYKFAVVPMLVPVEFIDADNCIRHYADFNFSTEYNRAVRDGKKFVIKDPNSQIFKHGAVSYRTITRPVENLEQYFEDFD